MSHRLCLLGINHHSSSIDIRERFYFSPLEQELFLSELKNCHEISGGWILSTCNRTEALITLKDEYARLKKADDILYRLIFGIKKIRLAPALKKHFYFYQGHDALMHLFKVVCSLDSLVVGEKQILGQVKKSIATAREKNTLDRFTNILQQVLIRTGKLAQTQSQISVGGSSISWAAVELMHKKMGTLEGKRVLLLGSGKMGGLLVRNLKQHKVGSIYIMNRTIERAKKVAETIKEGTVLPFSHIKEALLQVDLCFCSAGAPHYLIEKETVIEAMKSRPEMPLFFCDLSVPRNIDPRIAQVSGVELLEMDDLKEVVEHNMKLRKKAVSEVLRLIDRKLSEFLTKLGRADREMAVV